MFEKPEYTCPQCGFAVGQTLKDEDAFVCRTCQSRFRVAVDPETNRIALFEEGGRQVPEPLFMPKGSIRALVAMGMAVCCWVLIARNQDVPTYLLGILLATVG